MSFAGKVVLITGAASGMGRCTAMKFAQLGAKLAIADKNVQKLMETGEMIKTSSQGRGSSGCKIQTEAPLMLDVDMTSEKNVECMYSETINKYKCLHVLANVAGIMQEGSIENTCLQQFDHIMATNIRGAYQLITLAAPALIKSKGNIVNVSSVCGLRSFPNILAYCISKAAVDQLTRCVALELGLKGVRCNAVNPGVILTDLHQTFMNEKRYAKFLERAKDTHALGRAGEPDEVADAICFLASEKASFITGVTLSVDGGRHAMCPR